MEEKEIIESLSPIERKLIPLLSTQEIDIDKLVNHQMDRTTIVRAVGFLSNKGLISQTQKEIKIIDLGTFGVLYLRNGLPERKLLNVIVEKKDLQIKNIKSETKLNDNEIKVAIGSLRKKNLVEVKNGILTLNVAPGVIVNKTDEELFLETLPRDYNSLDEDELKTYDTLLNRKDIVTLNERKEILVKLTSLGEKISLQNIKEELLEQVTPKLLKSNVWNTKKFRRYDLSLPVPRIYGGKRHFVNQATDYAKRIWLDMGFKEMTGNMITTGFYNFDALFTAQDHPVREMQDTFFIKDIVGKLPEKSIVNAVKKAHEGQCDGSKGWCSNWREEDAKKVLLRTHTTPWSIKKLQEIANTKEFPAKYFALDKCFRNETIDWSHGFEFNQTEGIVVDENANFRQLLGYLIQFFKKMGYNNIRIRPAYFPYTEPSIEMDFFHPVHKKWMELGGAGMFRPEVVIPIFGKYIPVLAWGPGFDRIITQFFEINDLREMYKNDITKLRDIKLWNL